MNHPWQARKANAFTLAEALVASAILVASITAVSLPFSTAAHNQLAEARRTVAVALAQELMEEILSKPFADPNGASAPGPEAGETTRALFDNLDDYDGLAESEGQITGLDGQIVSTPAATGLSRSATVSYIYMGGQSTASPPSFIRVTVAIRFHDQPEVSLTRLVYDLK